MPADSFGRMTETTTMTVDIVRAEIRSAIRGILREPELPVTSDDGLRDQLGLDSADLAELVVTLEERLGVSLPDTALAPTATRDPLSTVAKLADTVAEVTHAQR